jgi:hypothetical protein
MSFLQTERERYESHSFSQDSVSEQQNHSLEDLDDDQLLQQLNETT